MTLYYNKDSRTAIPEINCKWLSVKATKFLFSQNNSGLHYQKQPPEKVFYMKNGVKKLSKFTGKHLCQSLFFNKATCLRPATLYNKTGTGVFLWILQNFKEFSHRTPPDACFSKYMFYKKVALKSLSKFTGKGSLFHEI